MCDSWPFSKKKKNGLRRVKVDVAASGALFQGGGRGLERTWPE